MPLQATPDAPLDARRLHGYVAPGPAGIIWRNLANPARMPWSERHAQLIAETERTFARASLDTGLPGITTASHGWRAPAANADDLPTAQLPWTHPDSTPVADIEAALDAHNLSIERR